MACRVWWVLRYCGAADVRVLAGGLNAWRATGLPLSVHATRRTRTHFSACIRPELHAGGDAALAAAQAGRLIDVRSSGEYLGLRSGYSYLERAGRIPGAVHADAEPLSALLDRGDLAGVAAYWRACGVLLQTGSVGGVEDATLARVFYCGSGWRSSVACFCAQLLDVPDARNYSEGWCGWSTHYVQVAIARDAPTGARGEASTGSTQGWRQDATGNPIASG